MSRKVLVTAGASGIGLHIAAAFLKSGDDVYICDINPDGLKMAAAELKGVKSSVCNVGDRGQIETMVAEAAETLGGIDVLVNNAGISGPTAPIQEVDADQWEQVLQVNLTGTFNVTKNAIPHLVRSGKGVIIIMSSAAGRFGYPNRIAYATAKWGLIGFTKTLSMELGEYNIRANAILPGAVAGDRIQRVFETRAKATARASKRSSPSQCRIRALSTSSIRMTSPRLLSFWRPMQPSPYPARSCRSTGTCSATEASDMVESRKSGRSTSTPMRRSRAAVTPTAVMTSCRARWAIYRERNVAAFIFPINSERERGYRHYNNEEVAEIWAENSDILIPFASIDSHKRKMGAKSIRCTLGGRETIGVDRKMGRVQARLGAQSGRHVWRPARQWWMSVRSRRDPTEGNAVRPGGAIAAILEDRRRYRLKRLSGYPDRNQNGSLPC